MLTTGLRENNLQTTMQRAHQKNKPRSVLFKYKMEKAKRNQTNSTPAMPAMSEETNHTPCKSGTPYPTKSNTPSVVLHMEQP